MAITEAVLLVRVKKRTRRDELSSIGDGSKNDFTFYLLEALKQLSQDSLALRSSATGSVSSSTNTITMPTDMIEDNGAMDALRLGSNADSTDDSLLQNITWDEYIQGRIAGIVLRNGVIYVRPIPDTDLTYTLYYRKFHADSTTTIEFGLKWQQAIITLCCKLVYEDLELVGKADDQEVKYRRELAAVADTTDPPVCVGNRFR